MLFLPLEEDSLFFRLCLYYGALVLLLELLVPLLFQRRVRIEIPRLVLRAPVVPLSTREFQHRRLALQQRLMELQRALEETAHWSPEKRRQSRSSAAKQRAAVSPSPSPSSSPLSSTSSIKMTRPRSSGKSSRAKLRMEEIEEKDQGADSSREAASRPMAMSDLLATSRRGGFSFDEVREGEQEEEKRQEEREHAVKTRPAKRRESPVFSGRRPVRLVEEMGRVGYNAPSEAATRLEALIRARRRQKAATSTSQVSAPVIAPVPVLPPAPASVAPAIESEKPLVNLPLRSSKQPSPELLPQPRTQQEQQAAEKDEETKESEPEKVLTDFQAFCATFAAGGSAAAIRAATKRKHHEAFESNVKTNGDAGDSTQDIGEKRKQPRVDEQIIGDSISAAATPQSVEKCTHYEACGSDDDKEVDSTVTAQQILEKRNHDQAFGTAKEQKQEKTPRIIRRISFSDDIDASPSKEALGEISAGKRTHKQAFGMHDDEDEDADWRDSLAFRPHNDIR